MTPVERAKIIAELKAIVAPIREALDKIADTMWEIQEEFQCDRRALLAAAKRQSGRGQASNLLLCIRSRHERPLGAPSADWKAIQARGHRASHAITTLATKRRRQPSPASRSGTTVNILSNTIAKNRKFGWRDMDILRHAHVCEYQLVKITEAKLRPLRRRVADLTRIGTRALQAIYQHERMLKTEANQDAISSTGVERASAKNATPESPTSGQFVPQLRFPDRHPQPVWSIARSISDHAAGDAQDTGAPPQLRRPV